MLYLVATPIGNLADLSYRAVEVLRAADYILCEDTRHSKILLSHYQIAKPLKSYHQFNESSRQDEVIADLKAGKQIALISDAGTPGIADPGHRLVVRCKQEKLEISGLPGACAAILALILSGFSTERFQFIGFLPKKAGELRRSLEEALLYSGTTICYETPHRLIKTLGLLQELDAKRRFCCARELTKRFEETVEGTAGEILLHFQEHPLKGEIVLLIEGKSDAPVDLSLSPEEHVQLLQEEEDLSTQEAIKKVASLRKIPKRELYQQVHKKPD